MVTKKSVRYLDLDPVLGEYVLTEEDGIVVRIGKNPDHLAAWSLGTAATTEVNHRYDLREWERIRWKR